VGKKKFFEKKEWGWVGGVHIALLGRLRRKRALRE